VTVNLAADRSVALPTHPPSVQAIASILVLAGALTLLPPITADDRPVQESREPSGHADEQPPAEDEQEPVEDEQESVEDEQESAEDEPVDVAPDAHYDPVLKRLLEPLIRIERPGYSIESHGKLQVQYLGADAEDPVLEEDVFVRLFRPFVFGTIGESWRWKFEVELNSEIDARKIDLDQLDLRDVYVRYEASAGTSWRLTLGNQRAPYSRDWMTSKTQLLLVERTPAGSQRAGVPDRVLGIHFRGESRKGRISYWAAAGDLGHEPDVGSLRFDSVIGGGGNLNTGLVFAGRLDLHPGGPMTFADGDEHSPELKHTWSLAGYRWENDGHTNHFTEGGVSLDPERADLDSATGLEISGGLRGRGITLDYQHNRIRGETRVPGFTGGIYTDGDSRLTVSAVEGAYRFRRSFVELGGALSRVDADGFQDPSRRATAVVNLYLVRRFMYKLQISHTWDSSRGGVPGDDFQTTRAQFQYVW